MLNLIHLSSLLIFLSCAEPSPEESTVVIQEKDINSSDVVEDGENPTEPVVDPKDPEYTDADPLDIPESEELSSFRMKAYLYYHPYDNIASSVTMTDSLQLQIPKKISLLSDELSIQNDQIASLRYNTTEYCYKGIVSTDPDAPSHFELDSYKDYDPDNQCVNELMQLDYLGVTNGPVTLMENANAYIAESKDTSMQYGYMRYQGETARFTIELLNSTLYLGSLKDGAIDLANSLNWNYGFQIILVNKTKFQVAKLAHVEVFSPGRIHYIESAVIKLRFRGDNRIELLVNSEVVGVSDGNFFTEQILDFGVKHPHNVIPIVSSAVSANLPDKLEPKDAPILNVIAGDIFELKNSFNSNKDSSVIKARLKAVE